MNIDTTQQIRFDDLQRGDWVTILWRYYEPGRSFFAEPDNRPWSERVERCPPHDGGAPLRVEEIALPYIYVSEVNGKPRVIDVRFTVLARLPRRYAAALRIKLAERAEPLFCSGEDESED